MNPNELYRSALNSYHQGNFALARQLLSPILTSQNPGFEPLQLLGVVCVRLQDYQVALSTYEKLSSIKKKDVNILTTLGDLYRETGDFKSAITTYKKILKIKTISPDVLNSLGIAYRSTDQIKNATDSFRKAHNQKPDNIDILNNYALSLHETGDTPAAGKILLKAVKAEPNHFLSLKNLGFICAQQDNPFDAIHYYKQALAAKPDARDLLLDIASVSLQYGLYSEARKSVDIFLETNPEHKAANAIKAEISLETNDLDSAIEYFEKSYKDKPDSAEHHLHRAKAFKQYGQLEQSKFEYTLALNTSESNTEKYEALRGLSDLDKTENYIEALTTLLDEKDIDKNTRCQILFTLGKLEDKAGNYDIAFDYYKKGNNLKHITFDRKSFDTKITSAKQVFSKEFFSRPDDFEETFSKVTPVFIVGMPRSGTSLLEQILSSHSKIYGGGEQVYLPSLTKQIESSLGKNKTFNHFFENSTKNEIDSIRKNYHEYLQTFVSDEIYLTDKLPNNFLRLGFIHKIFPEAKIIHCQRNPADTCLSIYFQNFVSQMDFSYDLKNIAYAYNGYKDLMNFWSEIFDKPIFQVEYEKLVTDPDQIVPELLDFLELEREEITTNFNKTKRQVKTASITQVREDLHQRSVERFLNYQSHLGALLENIKEDRLHS